MGENNSKWNNWQRINFQNIEAAHTTQSQKNKSLDQKVGKRPKQTFLQRHTHGWQTHEKMLNTAHYQRNANQNYNELSPHTSQNGHHRKSTNNKCWTGVEKRECSCTVGGNVNWYSHYRRWYGDSLWPSNSTPTHIPWENQNWKRHMYPIVFCSTI